MRMAVAVTVTVTILAAEGDQVVLAGGMSPIDGPGIEPVDAKHAACLVEDYWTGIIDVQTND